MHHIDGVDVVRALANGEPVRAELILLTRIDWSGTGRVHLLVESLAWRRDGKHLRRGVVPRVDEVHGAAAEPRGHHPFGSGNRHQVLWAHDSADELHVAVRRAPALLRPDDR